jgi:hypothetical protein
MNKTVEWIVNNEYVADENGYYGKLLLATKLVETLHRSTITKFSGTIACDKGRVHSGSSRV